MPSVKTILKLAISLLAVIRVSPQIVATTQAPKYDLSAYAKHASSRAPHTVIRVLPPLHFQLPMETNKIEFKRCGKESAEKKIVLHPILIPILPESENFSLEQLFVEQSDKSVSKHSFPIGKKVGAILKDPQCWYQKGRWNQAAQCDNASKNSEGDKIDETKIISTLSSWSEELEVIKENSALLKENAERIKGQFKQLDLKPSLQSFENRLSSDD